MSINHFFCKYFDSSSIRSHQNHLIKVSVGPAERQPTKKNCRRRQLSCATKVCQQFVVPLNNLFSTLGCLFDSCAHSRRITADNSTIKFDPTWLPHDACPKSPGKCVTFARRISGQQHKIDSPCVRPTASSTKHSLAFLSMTCDQSVRQHGIHIHMYDISGSVFELATAKPLVRWPCARCVPGLTPELKRRRIRAH